MYSTSSLNNIRNGYEILVFKFKVFITKKDRFPEIRHFYFERNQEKMICYNFFCIFFPNY